MQLTSWLALGSSCVLMAAAADLDTISRGSFAPSVRTSTPEPVVLTWNVDKGRDVNALTAALSRLRPDICLLQEIDLNARRTDQHDVTEALARRLEMDYAFAPAYEELSQGEKGQPAFVGQALLSRLPIRALRVIRFRAQSRFWEPRHRLPNWQIMQRRHGGRIALVAELSTSSGPLVLYNLHLESRGNAKGRRRQLDEVLEDARRYPPSTTVVIAGDLNSKYNPTAVLRHMEASGFANACGPRKQRTHKLVGSVDWIFVRGPQVPKDGEVHREVRASDHFPVTVRLLAPPKT